MEYLNKKGQGSLEYLLVAGAAILIVAIVIVAVAVVVSVGKTSVDSSTQSAQSGQARLACDTNISFLGFENNQYGCCSAYPDLNQTHEECKAHPEQYNYLFDGQTRQLAWTQPFDYNAEQRIIVSPQTNYGIFKKGDAVGISSANANCSGTLRLFNMENKTIARGPVTLSDLNLGQYFVECLADTNGDRYTFVVLPAGYDGSNLIGSDSYHPWNGPEIEQKRNLSEAHWLRGGYGLYWYEIMSGGDNTYNWTIADQTMNTFFAGKKGIVNILGRPSWQTNDNEFAEKFAEFAAKVVERYGGRIEAVEVWNEPSYATTQFVFKIPDYDLSRGYTKDWNQTYIDMVNLTVAKVRQVNQLHGTSVKVYGGVTNIFWNYRNFFDDIARNEANGGERLDGISWHDYDVGRFTPDQFDYIPPVYEEMDWLKQHFGDRDYLIDEFGMHGQSSIGVPTDLTEPYDNGYYSDLSWHRGMSRDIKSFVMHYGGSSNGKGFVFLPHVFPYATRLNISGWEYLMNPNQVFWDRGPHPKTSALLFVANLLNNSQIVGHSVLDANTTFLYQFKTSSGEDVVFAWAKEGLRINLPPNSVSAIDLFGVPVQVVALGEEPVIFRGKSIAEVEALLPSP